MKIVGHTIVKTPGQLLILFTDDEGKLIKDYGFYIAIYHNRPMPLIFKKNENSEFSELCISYLLRKKLCTKINDFQYRLTDKILKELSIEDLKDILKAIKVRIKILNTHLSLRYK